jgi:predicted RNase H-like HicB family nuclease
MKTTTNKGTAMCTYKNVTIEKTFPSGYYIGTVRNYREGVTFRADTLNEIRSMIREQLNEWHLEESC